MGHWNEFLLGLLMFSQMLMESSLLPSTGNHLQNVLTNGITHDQKCQNHCAYMSVMLELVAQSQKYLPSKILGRRFFLM
uniref:Secreted protein n=1 Tax=Rhizophora mucronata TaxID=61149 RepID=A0A2P2LZD8_RHIMU